MKKKLLPVLQLFVGVGLIGVLFYSINVKSTRATFTILPQLLNAGDIYSPDGSEAEFTVLGLSNQDATLQTLVSEKLDVEDIPATPLLLISGDGPKIITWTNVTCEPYGLRLIAQSFVLAGSNWIFSVAGVLCFLGCILLVAKRWQLILAAQGLALSYTRVLTLYFIGHFFNAFLPGATSGDLVKAYFAAREAPDKKTEAVSTIFIDRILGLLALIVLTVGIMAFRFRFFISYTQTRWALVFNFILLLGASTGLLVVFRQNVFERFTIFRRLEQKTALGQIVAKVYNSFRVCLNHPGLLWRTGALSLANHLMLVVSAYCMGRALETGLTAIQCLTVFPIINAFSALPLTPGGLGTREAASRFLLGVLGVTAARAVSLSLLVYGSMLFWSLVGGVVYAAYSARYGVTRKSLVGETDSDQQAD